MKKMMPHQIRAIVKEDLPALKKVLNSIDLFPAEMLDEMIDDYFSNPVSEDIWFTTLENNHPVSIAYCVPEKLTDGTFNLLAIGVSKDRQGAGIGSRMLNYIEQQLMAEGHRILIVETSSGSSFASTRQFYLNRNYFQEAVIREFWAKGEDKIVFWKKLS